MAKSITGGLGAVNLTIQELRLLEIKTTGIETTDATILNNLTGNNATFSGTVTIGNVSLENATVDNLTVNVSLTANDITTSGTITANGNLVVSSLPEDNMDDNERYITFQGVGNVLHGDSKLTFNPSTNTLTITFLDVQDINATGTISGTFNIVAENKTDDINFPISFHDTSTNRVSIGDASYLSSFTYNPISRKMILENGQITNGTIASADITYLKIGQLRTTSNDVFYACMFQGDNNNISQASPSANFHYNPLELKLKLDNVEVTDELQARNGDISNKLTVGDILEVGGDINITGGSVDVLNGDITLDSGDLYVDSGDINLNNGDLTMTSGTLTANIVSADFIRLQPLPSGNTPGQVPLVFCDTSDNNTLKQDTEPLRLSYTPSLNKFHAGNAEINNQLEVLGDATITNDLTITTGTLTVPDLTVTNSASITGLVLNLTSTNAQREFDVVLKDRNSPFSFSKELDSTHLTYNPFYSRLTVFDINCTDKLTIEQQASGTDDGEIFCNSTGLLYDQLQGHFFKTNGNDKFRIKAGRVECVTSLYLNSVTVPGTSAAFPFLVHNPGTDQIKITDTANNALYCDPVNGKITATTIEVTGNVDVNTDLQVDGSATIEDDITINSQTLVTANRNLNILLHENQTNDKRIKENNDFYYNPNAEELTVTNITVTGAIVNNLIPLNYTTVFSTRYSGSGTYGGNAWTMFNVTGAAGEDTEYTGGATGRLFGLQNQIMWPYTSAAGGAPTISQYGRDSTGTSYIDFGFGASSDSGDKFRLLSSQYQGWWYCEINIFYQNTNGGSRDMPYIRLMKQVNGTGAYIEQPQVSQGSEYLRYDSGEVSNLKIAGPIYFNNNTGTNFRIYTLLEQGNINNNPPPWNNESTNYLGLGLNISLRFLGKSAVGEQVTTL